LLKLHTTLNRLQKMICLAIVLNCPHHLNESETRQFQNCFKTVSKLFQNLFQFHFNCTDSSKLYDVRQENKRPKKVTNVPSVIAFG